MTKLSLNSVEIEQEEPSEKGKAILHELELRNARVNQEGGIEYYEVDNPEDFFNWAGNNGFIFHGSQNLLSVIEPRQADDVYRKEGRLNAVYMSDSPVVSMSKTIIGNQKGGYSFKSDLQGNTVPVYLYVKDLTKTTEVGYLYIIDSKDSDEVVDGDIVSYSPVKPLAIVKFTRADFKYEIEERN